VLRAAATLALIAAASVSVSESNSWMGTMYGGSLTNRNSEPSVRTSLAKEWRWSRFFALLTAFLACRKDRGSRSARSPSRIFSIGR
jgi:hypothetical protein